MNTTFSIAQIRRNFFIQSQIDSVVWIKNTIYAGFYTSYEVKTSHIDQWTLMKMTCWTDDGKQLDSYEGFINSCKYRGKVFIPYTIKSNTHIHLIVQLPEHNTFYISNNISVRTSLQL